MGEENSFRKKKQEMEKNLDKDPVDLGVVSKESQEEDNSSDKDYIPEEKKGKYEFNTFGKMNDDMPDEYKHPLHGLRSVRTELYIQSCPNCSLNFTYPNVKLKEPL